MCGRDEVRIRPNNKTNKRARRNNKCVIHTNAPGSASWESRCAARCCRRAVAVEMSDDGRRSWPDAPHRHRVECTPRAGGAARGRCDRDRCVSRRQCAGRCVHVGHAERCHGCGRKVSIHRGPERHIPRRWRDSRRVPGQAFITPLHLPTTTARVVDQIENRLRFLQMLDLDGNPENGIEISESARARAANWPEVDFTMAAAISRRHSPPSAQTRQARMAALT